MKESRSLWREIQRRFSCHWNNWKRSEAWKIQRHHHIMFAIFFYPHVVCMSLQDLPVFVWEFGICGVLWRRNMMGDSGTFAPRNQYRVVARLLEFALILDFSFMVESEQNDRPYLMNDVHNLIVSSCSVNNYGVILDEIGMSDMVLAFQRDYLWPFAKALFPNQSTPLVSTVRCTGWVLSSLLFSWLISCL